MWPGIWFIRGSQIRKQRHYGVIIGMPMALSVKVLLLDYWLPLVSQEILQLIWLLKNGEWLWPGGRRLNSEAFRLQQSDLAILPHLGMYTIQWKDGKSERFIVKSAVEQLKTCQGKVGGLWWYGIWELFLDMPSYFGSKAEHSYLLRIDLKVDVWGWRVFYVELSLNSSATYASNVLFSNYMGKSYEVMFDK